MQIMRCFDFIQLRCSTISLNITRKSLSKQAYEVHNHNHIFQDAGFGTQIEAALLLTIFSCYTKNTAIISHLLVMPTEVQTFQWIRQSPSSIYNLRNYP
jgi:hypothetical protein